MIFADTDKPVTHFAKEYYFAGPACDVERMELLDAAEGLRALRRITQPLFNQLVDTVIGRECVIKGNTDMARMLHLVLEDYATGLNTYYSRINALVDPADIESPLIIGSDGLRRVVSDKRLVIDARPLTVEAVDGLLNTVPAGLTHMTEQYDFPRHGATRIEHLPTAHYSLGTMLGDAYRPYQTLLTDTEQQRAYADQTRVAELRRSVPLANVVNVAPRL